MFYVLYALEQIDTAFKFEKIGNALKHLIDIRLMKLLSLNSNQFNQ